MRCDRFREAASARLDGEPIGMASTALDHHLATCANCARWVADATRVTRLARLGSIDQPDLTESIVSDTILPVRRVLWRRNLLRIALVITGLVQLVISVPSMFGDTMAMPMSMHASHEVAAWNCAMAVALLASAARPRRAAGVFAVLATFVAVLTLLSIRDVAGGVVTVGRLATHLGAVAGLVLVAALTRVEAALPPERPTAGLDERGEGRGDGRLRGAA